MARSKKTLSIWSRRNLLLHELYAASRVMREAGEILDVESWLKVLANLLSGAPPTSCEDRRGPHAPETYFGLRWLAEAAAKCGLGATAEQIEAQAGSTRAWRMKESDRIGRPHYVSISGANAAKILGITEAVRRDIDGRLLGACDATREQLKEAAKERARARDRARYRRMGMRPQSQSLSRTKPWEAEGISRRTWERRRATSASPDDGAQNDANSCVTNKGSNSEANADASLRDASLRANNKGRDASLRANNIEAAGFPLASTGKTKTTSPAAAVPTAIADALDLLERLEGDAAPLRINPDIVGAERFFGIREGDGRKIAARA